MDMDEIKSRYKGLPAWGRLLGITLLALLPAAYTWWDEGEALDEKLAAAHASEDTNREAFERDRSKKGNLPKLEEQKAFTMEQLEKARKKLPELIHIEDVLQKIATIAKETGVKLKVFRPLKEIKGGQEFKYYELPIATEINGKFSALASFYDRIVHLEGTVFVRNIDISPKVGEKVDGRPGIKVSEADRERRERAEMTLDSAFEIVLFRGMSAAEQLTAEAEAGMLNEGAGNGSGSGGKNRAPPPAGEPPGGTPPPVDGAAPPTAQNETTVIGGKHRM